MTRCSCACSRNTRPPSAPKRRPPGRPLRQRATARAQKAAARAEKAASVRRTRSTAPRPKIAAQLIPAVAICMERPQQTLVPPQPNSRRARSMLRRPLMRERQTKGSTRSPATRTLVPHLWLTMTWRLIATAVPRGIVSTSSETRRRLPFSWNRRLRTRKRKRRAMKKMRKGKSWRCHCSPSVSRGPSKRQGVPREQRAEAWRAPRHTPMAWIATPRPARLQQMPRAMKTLGLHRVQRARRTRRPRECGFRRSPRPARHRRRCPCCLVRRSAPSWIAKCHSSHGCRCCRLSAEIRRRLTCSF
mmetsp:Transcript_57724/g.160915  ORF Transcript_57724/g.160915 Transcript_57724/m.160915 type:complete len:302 (-) Transcript_57724:101-1006(-)